MYREEGQRFRIPRGGGCYNPTEPQRKRQELNESGIRRVEYESEKGRHHSQRLDTAVRRNLMDGVRQVSMNVQDEIGKEFGANGVELTVHAYPAPDHAPIQGLKANFRPHL